MSLVPPDKISCHSSQQIREITGKQIFHRKNQRQKTDDVSHDAKRQTLEIKAGGDYPACEE